MTDNLPFKPPQNPYIVIHTDDSKLPTLFIDQLGNIVIDENAPKEDLIGALELLGQIIYESSHTINSGNVQ